MFRLLLFFLLSAVAVCDAFDSCLIRVSVRLSIEIAKEQKTEKTTNNKHIIVMICDGCVSKYAMGRSTGFSVKNWKQRHLTLTRYTLAYAEKQGAEPKHEMYVNAISVVWQNPTSRDHPEADAGKPMILLRVWSHGVFDLLVNCVTPLEKEKWINGLKEALKDMKGVQWP